MITTIRVRFAVEGFHNWPQAKDLLPEVAFLSDRHRHLFFFDLEKAVTHDDRDVEIILFKRQVMNYLNRKYGAPCEFGSKSCEMLGVELVKEFDLVRCSVLEDDENGAVTYNGE